MGRFIHVAVFTWKPGVTDAERAALVDGLAALPALIPELRAYRFGPDVGLTTGNDEFAIVAEVDDVEAYRRYAAEPHHVDVIERLVRPILQSRHAVQFTAT
ncbi:MAG: Dabb family protein [Actinomycetota bacterium]|nr:Dabb family protein [Actinomycetota bacterium]